jgi:VWFA-related protein
MPRFRSIFLGLAFFPLLAGTAFAQAPGQIETEAPATTLKVTARSVLVDVVVKDKDGRALPGLRKEDFQVNENGKRQKIDFFEPHFPAAPGAVPAAPPLPPNTFTNVPATAPNEAVNVLLLDVLNTDLTDQMYVRQQVVKYLGTVPPGMRIGIFMLSDKLSIIQGFTDDSQLLHASVDRFAKKPTLATEESTPDELAAQSTAMNNLKTMMSGQGGGQMASMVSSLQTFLDENTSSQQNRQLLITLDSLRTIAHYLSAVPGRKNLIWFVGSFPLCLQAVTTDMKGCPYEDVVEKTINEMAAARVAVYPIDAGGVMGPNADISGNGGNQAGSLIAGTSIPGQHAATGSTDPEFAFINSENWAEETGGKAFHNNDVQAETADAVADGSSYYTLAYTPKIGEEQGRERKIEVSIPSGKYKLAYHRSYFEQTPKELKAAAAAPAKDPLRPLMDRGMPNFDDLQYHAHVEALYPQPATGAPIAGDDPTLKRPFTRYTVRFALSPEHVNLIKGPDGVRRQTVEVALVAYGQNGKQLNWMVRSIGLAVRPDQMAQAQASGISFHFDFDAPPGDVYLRTGIYDTSTSKAGTLEIPLRSVVVARR